MDARGMRARVCDEYSSVLEAMSSAVQASNEQILSLREYIRTLETENAELRDEVSQLRAVLKHMPQDEQNKSKAPGGGLSDTRLTAQLKASTANDCEESDEVDIKDRDESDEFTSSLRVASAHRQNGDWVPPRFESTVATTHAQWSVPLQRSPSAPLANQESLRDFGKTPALSLSCLESNPLKPGDSSERTASTLLAGQTEAQGPLHTHSVQSESTRQRRYAPFTEQRRASLRKARYRPVAQSSLETVLASPDSSEEDGDADDAVVETTRAAPPASSALVRRLATQMRQRAVQVDKLYYSMDRFRTDSASFGEFSEGLQMCGIQLGLEEQAELFAEIDTEHRHRISWHQLRDCVEPLLHYLREQALARRTEQSDAGTFSPSYSQQTISSAQKASPQKFYLSPRRRLLQDSAESVGTDNGIGIRFNGADWHASGGVRREDLGGISV